MGLLSWLGLAKIPNKARFIKRKSPKYTAWSYQKYEGKPIVDMQPGESVEFSDVKLAYKYARAMYSRGYKVKRHRHADGCAVTILATRGNYMGVTNEK